MKSLTCMLCVLFLGTYVPFICSNGTYTDSNTTGLQGASECLPCETSYYCRSGQLIATCAAGYYCKSGAKEDIPLTTGNFSDCQPDDECAGPCPTGHYCEDGTMVPTPCPETTFRNVSGGEQINDCEPCTAGFMCNNGKVLLLLLHQLSKQRATLAHL